ncbi:hypothetical protein G7084_06570 [Weissella coleopterorum]|uniref:Uncharacterized protein n=1 Tax=Weissella coleopterorum TaxID=2714949 RepID=A0A6G8B0X5_9LACO|nr:hypothetical protein [Weissella coleopterorum]QIL50991.1 hypothetical protein G7084_06570 [Weissella coleopterorum]
MQLTGNEVIEVLKNEEIEQRIWTAEDQTLIKLDPLFTFLKQKIQENKLVSGEIIISGDEPIHLSVETNLINLPLRYINQISKIIINDPANEVNLYMFVDHPDVTKSGMRIELAASVQSFLDDSESVMGKIALFFDRELKNIIENQKLKAEQKADDNSAETELKD